VKVNEGKAPRKTGDSIRHPLLDILLILFPLTPVDQRPDVPFDHCDHLRVGRRGALVFSSIFPSW
jgi:hypothetical protein